MPGRAPPEKRRRGGKGTAVRRANEASFQARRERRLSRRSLGLVSSRRGPGGVSWPGVEEARPSREAEGRWSATAFAPLRRRGEPRGECRRGADRGARAVRGGDRAEDGIARAHAPNGMLSVKNCVHAAAPAKPTSVATPMAPPVGLTGGIWGMIPRTRRVRGRAMVGRGRRISLAVARVRSEIFS